LPGTVLVHRCVCHGCSRCLLDEDDPRMIKIMSIKDGIKRLAKLAAVCQTIDYCGGQPPTATTTGDNGLTPKQMCQFAKNPNKLARGCGAAQRVYIQNKLNINCYLKKAKVNKKLLAAAAAAAAQRA